MKSALAFLALIVAAVASPWLATPAQAQPCQWNYSQPGNVSQARYCGNVVVDGSITGTVVQSPEPANTVLAGPTSGIDDFPNFRALIVADIPVLTAAKMPAFTGDATSSAGTSALTLATVNANIGTFQGITINGKGLVTAAADQGYVTAASLPIGANPTATIGASAVNGVATTFMRSDAAPPLPATLPALSGANLTALNATQLTSGTIPNARIVALPNANLANSATTVNGQTCTLGAACTVTAAAAGITIGTTTVSGGSNGNVEYNNAGLLGEMTTSGSGTVLALATGATLIAPNLGTPASGTLTNATGLPVSTGISGLATGVATFLATSSSANLRAALTDESGTGAAFFQGGNFLVGSGTSLALGGATIGTDALGVTGTVTFYVSGSTKSQAFGSDGSLQLVPNGSTLKVGRQLDVAFNHGGIIGMPSTMAFGWTSTVDGGDTVDTFLGRQGAASLRIGAVDVDTNAAIVAQTIRSQGALAGGTADQAGKNLTYLASPGKGSACGGSHVFQVGIAGSSGTVVNTATTALTIDCTKATIFAGIAKIGGTTSSFPGLKNSGANLIVTKADDSGYANIDTLGYLVSGVAGVSCSANTVTILTEVVTFGIVTHC